jgi:hypothetical protein
MGFRMRQSNSKSKIFPQPPFHYVGRYSGGPSLNFSNRLDMIYCFFCSCLFMVPFEIIFVCLSKIGTSIIEWHYKRINSMYMILCSSIKLFEQLNILFFTLSVSFFLPFALCIFFLLNDFSINGQSFLFGLFFFSFFSRSFSRQMV